MYCLNRASRSLAKTGFETRQTAREGHQYLENKVPLNGNCFLRAPRVSLGPFLEHFWAPLGPLWAPLGALWAPLGAHWVSLGLSGALLELFFRLFGSKGASPETCENVRKTDGFDGLRVPWGSPGLPWASLGGFLGLSGTLLGRSGALLVSLGVLFPVF